MQSFVAERAAMLCRLGAGRLDWSSACAFPENGTLWKATCPVKGHVTWFPQGRVLPFFVGVFRVAARVPVGRGRLGREASWTWEGLGRGRLGGERLFETSRCAFPTGQRLLRCLLPRFAPDDVRLDSNVARRRPMC